MLKIHWVIKKILGKKQDGFAKGDFIATVIASLLLCGIYTGTALKSAPSQSRPFFEDSSWDPSTIRSASRIMGMDTADLFESDWLFDREFVLSDSRDRISDEFSIPENLKDRVGFWFDVYTKWDHNKKVIHHSRAPWVVFKVIDVKDIVEASYPRRLWMRRERAQNHVRDEANKIRRAIESLAKRKNLENLSDIEQKVANALMRLGENVQEQAKAAIDNVRVQTGQRNYFMSGLVTSGRYLRTMEDIFEENGLPTELTRLPFVESSFNRNATSKVGAAGVWQFMPNTGRKFMTVNKLIDERRSPLKSAEAAAKLLRENHRILYQEWPLAITAWNHGPGGVRKAANAVKSRDIGEIVNNYRTKRFDTASSNFYAEFLAALYAEVYSDIAFPPIEKEQALDIQRVRLAKKVRVKNLISQSGLSQEEFFDVNPDLVRAARSNHLLPKGFKVFISHGAPQSIESLVIRDTPKIRTQAQR